MTPHDPADDEALEWLRLGEEACAAFRGGDHERARRCWRAAGQLANAGFSPQDPRIATHYGNLACALRLEGNHRESIRNNLRSIELWEGAANWVREMRLQSTARSSTFHLRMQQKHREAYQHPQREKYRQIAAVGRTTALNNLAETFHADGDTEKAREIYARALSGREQAARAAGLEDIGIKIIRRNLALLAEAPGATGAGETEPVVDGGTAFSEMARRRRWLVDEPPVLTDEGALMAAVLLAQILDHHALPRISRRD